METDCFSRKGPSRTTSTKLKNKKTPSMQNRASNASPGAMPLSWEADAVGLGAAVDLNAERVGDALGIVVAHVLVQDGVKVFLADNRPGARALGLLGELGAETVQVELAALGLGQFCNFSQIWLQFIFSLAGLRLSS